MTAPEQDRRPTGADNLRSAHGAGDAAHAGAKRAWTPPTVTTFKVTDTQGVGFNPGDGANNVTNGIP